MAEVNQGKENQAVLEFDYRPSRRQVEDKFIDLEAKRAIDRQEQLINRLDNLEGCEDNPVYAEEIIEIRKELVGLSEEECNVPSHSLILAREIDQFFYDFDVYDYRDQLTGSREDNIDSIRIDLESENVEHMLQALSSIMDDSSVALHADDNSPGSPGDEETYNKAKELIEDIKNYIALNKFLEQKSEDPNSSWIQRKVEEQAENDAREGENMKTEIVKMINEAETKKTIFYYSDCHKNGDQLWDDDYKYEWDDNEKKLILTFTDGWYGRTSKCDVDIRNFLATIDKKLETINSDNSMDGYQLWVNLSDEDRKLLESEVQIDSVWQAGHRE